MTEAIINLQALLVKSYLLNALLINGNTFPIGCHGAQALSGNQGEFRPKKRRLRASAAPRRTDWSDAGAKQISMVGNG